MSSTRHKKGILLYLVIFLYLILLCHCNNPAEGKSSPQFSTDQDKSDSNGLISKQISLSPQFHQITEEYYYDEDYDPYGFIDGKDNESIDEIDYAEENAKSGKKWIVIII